MTDYIHGYSPEERARLVAQARTLAPWVHRDLPFARARSLIEVGSGVGAQLELLLEAFPSLRVTGVDRSPVQLETARRLLAGRAATLVQAEATALPHAAGAFDAAFLCWVLEHVPSPRNVLAEVARVLAPGAPIVVTEVCNTTLTIWPDAPATMRYWAAFNAHQRAIGGDPIVGAKLGGLLHHAGFTDIVAKPGDLLFDDRDPAKRRHFAGYCKELLLSAAPGLGLDTAELERELDERGALPGSVIYYTFVQARATRAR